MRILVVDDEPLVARTLGLIFSRHGFETEVHARADLALLAAIAHPPDLVICDIDMPGRDGVALMQDLGRDLPGCPILVLTGLYASLARVRDCAKKLPQRVSIVTKPAQPNELLNTAGDLLKSA
jgi:DNA-binding response OmpR family regulator